MIYAVIRLLLTVKITKTKTRIIPVRQREGKVLKLYISTGDTTNPRKEVDTLTLDPKGVIGDKFYDKDPNRAILLSSKKSYKIAQKNTIHLQEGLLGENIYIDIDPYFLTPTESIQIGDVEFEVVQNCTLCKGLSRIDARLPKLLKEDRGIFLRAKTQGTIHIGDRVLIKNGR